LIAGGYTDTPILTAIGDNDRAEFGGESKPLWPAMPPEPRAAHIHILLDRAQFQGRRIDAGVNRGSIV